MHSLEHVSKEKQEIALKAIEEIWKHLKTLNNVTLWPQKEEELGKQSDDSKKLDYISARIYHMARDLEKVETFFTSGLYTPIDVTEAERSLRLAQEQIERATKMLFKRD